VAKPAALLELLAGLRRQGFGILEIHVASPCGRAPDHNRDPDRNRDRDPDPDHDPDPDPDHVRDPDHVHVRDPDHDPDHSYPARKMQAFTGGS
jgi:hypothetical protein